MSSTRRLAAPPARRPSFRRARLLLAGLLLALATLVASVLLVAASTAAGPPPLEIRALTIKHVHAIRAEVFANLEHVAAETTDRLEYAESPSGPWTLAATRHCTASRPSDCSLGDEAGDQPKESLHNLVPETTYLVRVRAENSQSSAERQIELTTTAVGSPEFLHAECSGVLGGFEALPKNPSDLAHPRMCLSEVATPTSAIVFAALDPDGAEASYRFEISSAESGPYAPVPGASGAAAGLLPQTELAHLTGLAPETTYFLRAIAENGHGSPAVETVEFQTPTAHPHAAIGQVLDVTATSAHVVGGVLPSSTETSYRFETATAETGPYTAVAGASGTISAAEAGQENLDVSADLTGLPAAPEHYVRLVAANHCNPAEPAEECVDTSSPLAFEAPGAPTASTIPTHGLEGESVRALGSVNPDDALSTEVQTIAVQGAPTGGAFTLTFKGQTTAPIPFDAPGSTVQDALNALSTLRSPQNENYSDGVFVQGLSGGPYTVQFVGSFAEADQPQIEADGSGLIPSGSVSATTDIQGGAAPSITYRVQYVTQEQFEAPDPAGGFAQAQSTAPLPVPAGEAYVETRPGRASILRFKASEPVLGAGLPALRPGLTYHYRFLATGPGGTATGAEQVIAVPVPAPAEPQSCPNQAERVGPSTNLPDCRAYELVTPPSKRGAQDIFSYSSNVDLAGLGEDGDHARLRGLAAYGPDPNPTTSEYFFSRRPGGWAMSSLTPPGSGVDSYFGGISTPDLTRVAALTYSTTSGAHHSPDQEFVLGPPGGPFAAVLATPFDQNQSTEFTPRDEWIVANPSLAKSVLTTTDHHLSGAPSTGTTAGAADLYEYSEGALRQANVDSGKTIGSCGARIPFGLEESQGGISFAPHAVSADGSKLFFEAIPSGPCPNSSELWTYEPAAFHSHLYMRVNGEETVDIGEYVFDSATPDGSTLLLGHDGSEFSYAYDTETRALTPLSLETGVEYRDRRDATVSADGTVVYFYSIRALTPDAPPVPSAGNVRDWYTFDLATRRLSFVAQTGPELEPQYSRWTSADGRFFYLATYFVHGLAAGGPYRYDRLTGAISSLSATPYRPLGGGRFIHAGEAGMMLGPVRGPRRPLVASDNGDYVFFESEAPLVPADVDGEGKPDDEATGIGQSGGAGVYTGAVDVYEWRADGVTGCSRISGCVSLITTGRGGYKNMLLGTTPSGNDVLIATHSQLVPQDVDSGGDVYDVRIGGGFPPPAPAAAECEGDACSAPAAAPVDPTPSSSTYSGPGNVRPAVTTNPQCPKGDALKSGKCVAKKHVTRHKRRHPTKHKHQARRRAGSNHGGAK